MRRADPRLPKPFVYGRAGLIYRAYPRLSPVTTAIAAELGIAPDHSAYGLHVTALGKPTDVLFLPRHSYAKGSLAFVPDYLESGLWIAPNAEAETAELLEALDLQG